MKFLAVFVVLVGVAAALPEPVAEPETPAHATLVSVCSGVVVCELIELTCLPVTGQERLQRQ